MKSWQRHIPARNVFDPTEIVQHSPSRVRVKGNIYGANLPGCAIRVHAGEIHVAGVAMAGEEFLGIVAPEALCLYL